MLNKLAEKAPLASPKFTGSPEVPTPTAGSTGLQAANMSALASAIAAASRSFRTAVIGVTTNLSLTAAQVGNAVQFNSGPVTVTLPAVADAGVGSTFVFRNPSSTVTQKLQVAGSGSLVDAGSTVATVDIKPFEFFEVVASGSSWFVIGRGKLREVAELDSPVFTGDPRAPTKATTDNSKSLANTEFAWALINSFGLGSRYPGYIADIDDVTMANGWYSIGAGTTAGVKPPGITYGVLLVSGRSNVAGANGRVVQIFLTTDSAVPRMLFRSYYGTNSWSGWEEHATLSALLSALQAVGLSVTGTPPTLADMDSATTPTGFYRVSVPAGTLPAGVSRYGTVIVERYTAANIRQTFSPVGGGEGREFSRTLGAAGLWLSWEESARVASPTFTGDVGVPTRATADRSANAASTQYVANLLASLGWGTSDLSDLASGVDLNTLNVGGSYQVNGAANVPTGYTGGVLFVVGTNAQYYTHQLLFPQGANKMFHRCSNGATNGVANWKDWEEITDLSTVTALIKAGRRYFSGNVVGVGANTTLTAGQTGFAFNATAAVTITLPAATDAGAGGTFSIRNVSSGNVTIALTSGQIYEKNSSAATAVLSPGEWVEVQASTTSYFINSRGKLGEVAELDSPSFTGSPTAPTKAVNDATKNLATTEFVELSKRNFAGPVLGFSSNMTLTAGQSGRLYQSNAANLTVTLPSAGNAPSGTAYAFRNTGGGTLTLTAPSGSIVSTVTASSLVLQSGEYVEVVNNTSTSWFVSTRGKLAEVPTVDAMNAAVAAAAPPGMVAHFALSSPPSGWLKRNGAAVSRTAYAALFAVIGTTFGAGDGSTTFNLPDDRELVDRAWTDGLNSADSGRTLFSAQADQLGIHGHTGSVSSAGTHSHTTNVKREYVNGLDSSGNVNAVYGDQVSEGEANLPSNAAGAHTHTVTINSTGGNETRMANRAYLACIKY
ncbi:tail fiber protein [Pseudomonas juntendi]